MTVSFFFHRIFQLLELTRDISFDCCFEFWLLELLLISTSHEVILQLFVLQLHGRHILLNIRYQGIVLLSWADESVHCQVFIVEFLELCDCIWPLFAYFSEQLCFKCILLFLDMSKNIFCLLNIIKLIQDAINLFLHFEFKIG